MNGGASALLARLAAAPGPGIRIGIEQEFEVWQDGKRLDFRDLIHGLNVDGLRLDPGDVNAYRLRSGMVLTCDEAEAEVATPPIPVGQGVAAAVVAAAAAARATLEAVLPPGCEARGYSTHLSVSAPGPADAALAERYARTFGPAFAMLIDRPQSLGIYIRPRPDRLELCGEFVEGTRLGAVAAFAAGSTLAAIAGQFPGETVLELLPCHERFGYRVHRSSTGVDLYSARRLALLRTPGGTTRRAQALLQEATALAEAQMARLGAAQDTAGLRAIADGEASAGIEVCGSELAGPAAPATASSYGMGIHRWQNGPRAVVPRVATWDRSIFEVRGACGPARYLAVPSTALRELAGALEEDFETVVDAILASNGTEEIGDPHTPSVHADLPADLTSLVPEEIPVDGPGGKQRGKPLSGARAGKASSARIYKFLPPIVLPLPRTPPGAPPAPGQPVEPPQAAPEPSSPLPPPPKGGPPWGVLAVIGAAAAGIIVVAAVAVSHGGSDAGMPSPTATMAPPTSESSPAPTKSSETATASPTPTKPAETATNPAGSSPTAAPATVAPATEVPPTAKPPLETPVNTQTPTATSTPTPTATATIRPTETPHPTNSPTPSPTKIPLPTFEPVPTSAPTAIGVPCTPSPGTVCR